MIKLINYATFALALLTFTACKNDKANADGRSGGGNDPNKINLIAGDWIAMDFVSRAGEYGSALAAMNNAHKPFAYAFTIDPDVPDSIRCFDGTESFTRAFRIQVDTFEILDARDGRSVFLVFDSQGEKGIQMFDGTQGRTQTDNFIKSKANAADGYLAFQTALNHNLFKGQYQLAGKPGSAVQFTPGGFIMGLQEYDRFKVCTAGDCFLTGDEMDVLELSNSKSTNDPLSAGFRFSLNKDTLQFFQLINENPEVRQASKIGKPLYTFLRTRAE